MRSWTLAALSLCACATPDDATSDQQYALAPVAHVFVVAMENHDAAQIYGNPDAPYLNGTVLALGAHATGFADELPNSVPSEPHYVWMEAGTNAFADHTFTSDMPPGWFSNSTTSTQHLVAQLRAGDDSWTSYQEGLNSMTGACPIKDWFNYAAKHDPFIFFRDVSGGGGAPSTTNAYCASHHKALTALAGDLAHDTVARYVFVTPNLCHDMHGGLFCADSNTVRAGDTWLHDNLPALIQYANDHDGVVMLTWDEGEGTQTMPFIAIGPGIKAGYTSSLPYTHSSQVRTIDELLGLPILPAVASSNDLADLFY